MGTLGLILGMLAGGRFVVWLINARYMPMNDYAFVSILLLSVVAGMFLGNIIGGFIGKCFSLGFNSLFNRANKKSD